MVVSVIGAALTPEPAISKGFAVTRADYTLDPRGGVLKLLPGFYQRFDTTGAPKPMIRMAIWRWSMPAHRSKAAIVCC